MKRRQFKHKWRTLQDISIKKQKRSSIWKFTSFKTLTQIRNLSWSEMSRLQKKQKPVTDRGIRFRSAKKLLWYKAQNVSQTERRRKSELQDWENKISKEYRRKGEVSR